MRCTAGMCLQLSGAVGMGCVVCPLTASDKRLAEVLDELETSGYLGKLTEAAAADDVEEGDGVGPEGGANVVEEYDVIDEEDIPSTEQVQVGGNVGRVGAELLMMM